MRNFISVYVSCFYQSLISHLARPISRLNVPFARTIVMLATSVSLLMVSPARATFFTPSQFDVTPSGAASYTVPIVVPPGTAGMAPSLALSYNSQGGNGLLGMGWRLSGLSAITRCPKTLIQDGVKSGVSYNTTDSLCLDGQRLVAIAGTYGASGTEYHTEGESFSKIVSYGTSGSPVTGPGYFKVWTKSGQVMEFGNTVDSAVENQGPAATAASRPIRVWSVNKITDSKGNYLVVKYAKDTVTWGAYVPTSILYTGNARAGLLPYSHVDFHLLARADTQIGYDAGSKIGTPWLIDHIYTYTVVNGVDTMVKDYQLTYDVSAATQRSRITQIKECDGGGLAQFCLSPTMMTWQKANSSGLPPVLWPLPDTTGRVVGMGDFNGDGYADAVYGVPVIVPAGNNGMGSYYYNYYVAYSNGSGYGAGVALGVASPAKVAASAATGDLNGDGKDDLYVNIGYTTSLFLGSSGGLKAASWPLSHATGRLVGTGDFNGDGYADAVYGVPVIVPAGNNGMGSYYYNYYVAYSNGSGYGAGVALGVASPAKVAASAATGDLNGDGKDDLYVNIGYTTSLFLGSSGGLKAASWPLSHATGRLVGTGDFNGDGYADAVYGVPVIVPAGDNGTGSYYYGYYVAYSNGSGYGAGVALGVASPAKVAALAATGDLNGDGQDDSYLNIGYATTLWLSSSPSPELLHKVTTGLGADISITYKIIADTTVYSKETTGVYPVRDLNSGAPLYVVSSVSSSNGVGGDYVSNYRYTGGKSHLTGGGFLGFRQTVNTDAQTGIVSTTTYRQDYPYQGLPLAAEKRTASGVLLNSVANTWTSTANPAWSAQYHAPQLTQSVESSYELTGGLISTVTTRNVYDSYGNPTSITVSTPDGYSKTTTNTYVNDLVNWYLGRLTNASITSTTP